MYFAQVGHESFWACTTARKSRAVRHTRAVATSATLSPATAFGTRAAARFRSRADTITVSLSRWAFGKGLSIVQPSSSTTRPCSASLEWGLLGAEWYWTAARPDINALSDRGDLDTVTRRINGGTNGIADRRERYRNAINLGNVILPRPAVPPRRVLPLDKGAIVTDTFGGGGPGARAVHWGVDYGKQGGSGVCSRVRHARRHRGRCRPRRRVRTLGTDRPPGSRR